MNDPITLPETKVELPPQVQTKWDREYGAFLHLLPELLKTHRGKYVAVHEAKVIDTGDDKVALALRAYDAFGYVPIYVGLVAERPLPRERHPSFRELREVPE
jgi:hypothetical protein